MKDKVLYLLGALVMPIVFPICIVLSFLTNLWAAAKECYVDTAYDTRLNWRSVVSFYNAGFPKSSDKERP